MELNELSSKLIQSYLNKLKAKKRAEQEAKPVTEAKIGDKVQVTHGSQKGLIGHVGEIRKGLGGQDHTYTVDYDDNGNRQSVQVKKAHTKVIKEASIHSTYMAGRGGSSARAKAPNASDKPDYGTYNVTVKHEGGEKTYKLKHMKEPKHAMNTAQKIHRKDNPNDKIKDVTYEKLSEENIVEVSKKVLGRYIEKAATSMSVAAFGQGQASASRRPPSEEDQKTGMKRMTGIARATSKLTKEEAESINELNKSTLGSYIKKAALSAVANSQKSRDHEDIASKNPESQVHRQLAVKFKDKSFKREAGVANAVSRLTKEDIEQVDELKKSTLSSYLDKTVDPVHGMPRSGEKLPQRMKGIERATKKLLAKEEVSKEVKPHEVSLQLKHPNLEGVTRKIVKINATSTNHAVELADKHYSSKGYKIHKVDYSKEFKVKQKPSPAEVAKQEEKKEDNKINKIAKAVKAAIK